MGKLNEEPALRDRVQVFMDRSHAGRLLAERLLGYRGQKVHLFAIPAGGVPVAAEIARGLALPLDLIIVRKIQLPYTTEAGFGALNPAGEAIFNEELLQRIHLSPEDIATQTDKTAAVIRRREERLRGGRPYPELAGEPAIVVDDGLASGYTMRAAVQFLQAPGRRPDHRGRAHRLVAHRPGPPAPGGRTPLPQRPLRLVLRRGRRLPKLV